MNTICSKMNGAKCAMDYCDYWNNECQKCSTALESEKRVEILNMVLERLEDILNNAHDKEQLLKTIKDLNIVSNSGMIQ